MLFEFRVCGCNRYFAVLSYGTDLLSIFHKWNIKKYLSNKCFSILY